VRYFSAADNPPATGAVDRFVRRYNGVSYALAVGAIYVMAASALGLALVPSLLVVSRTAPALWRWASWMRWPSLGMLGGAAVFLWGFSLLVVVPVFNALLPTRLRAFSGGYFTVAAVPWYLHNALFYLVRYTFLPFVTPTPIGVWFLRAMGMHMGRRSRITTENFTDVSMITLGDDVSIGGSAHIFCHYGGAGRLVIAPVVIGSRATIGEKATVMGDVEVGEGATVLAHSVLLPGTRVGPRERWGGVPAHPISPQEWDAYRTTVLGAATSARR
jgi:Bacterial transferase hexapeptide (six repeats)